MHSCNYETFLVAQVLEGDVTDPISLAEAFKDQEYCICTAGNAVKDPKEYDSIFAGDASGCRLHTLQKSPSLSNICSSRKAPSLIDCEYSSSKACRNSACRSKSHGRSQAYLDDGRSHNFGSAQQQWAAHAE